MDKLKDALLVRRRHLGFVAFGIAASSIRREHTDVGARAGRISLFPHRCSMIFFLGPDGHSIAHPLDFAKTLNPHEINQSVDSLSAVRKSEI